MSRHRLIEFATLESTNRYACQRLSELRDGTVIQASVQTAGRGRWERPWISDIPDNLSISLVLKPAGAPAELPLASLSQLLAVSACRVLETYGIQPALKWPNDIQVAGHKIAGILAETVVQGHELLGLVLGIGMNLNLESAVLARVDQPATALNLLLGHKVEVARVRDALLGDFFGHYESFLTARFPLIQEDYRRRCRFLGQEVLVHGPRDYVRGVARDITATGELELELVGGERCHLTQGEIVRFPD